MKSEKKKSIDMIDNLFTNQNNHLCTKSTRELKSIESPLKSRKSTLFINKIKNPESRKSVSPLIPRNKHIQVTESLNNDDIFSPTRRKSLALG